MNGSNYRVNNKCKTVFFFVTFGNGAFLPVLFTLKIKQLDYRVVHTHTPQETILTD